MKVDVNGMMIQVSEIALESISGLRSIVIRDNFGSIKVHRYERPHIGSSFVCDDEKLSYGSLGEAVSENLTWFLEGKK